MVEIEDRDFFDLLYTQWSKTYGAENMFWMPVEAKVGDDVFWEVYAVDAEKEQHLVASFQSEEDADFVSAVHGCLADLVRRLHSALDESERLDESKDDQSALTAELALENKELQLEVEKLTIEVEGLREQRDARECRIQELADELADFTYVVRKWGLL